MRVHVDLELNERFGTELSISSSHSRARTAAARPAFFPAQGSIHRSDARSPGPARRDVT